MKKIIANAITVATMIAIVLAMMAPVNVQAAANSKVKLSKTKATLTITSKKKSPSVQLKVKGVSKKAAKKAKWKTSNKKVAAVSKNGKVVAKKKGKATITAKVKGKKLTCKIAVVDKRKKSNTDSNKPQDTAPAWPGDPNCSHEWADVKYDRVFEKNWQLAAVPMDKKCYQAKEGSKTFFEFCPHCETAYKNDNVWNFAGSHGCPKQKCQNGHTDITECEQNWYGVFCANGHTAAYGPAPIKKYYIVIDQTCAKCGAYHEADEFNYTPAPGHMADDPRNFTYE